MKFNSNLVITLFAALSLSSAALAIAVKGTPPEGAISIDQIQQGAKDHEIKVQSVEYVVIEGENLIRLEGIDEDDEPIIALLDSQTGEISAMIDPATGNIMEEDEYEYEE